MNYDERIIDIVYDTVEENLNKFPNTPLKVYDNWKDDIIEKIQDYITEIKDKYEHLTPEEIAQEKAKASKAYRDAYWKPI